MISSAKTLYTGNLTDLITINPSKGTTTISKDFEIEYIRRVGNYVNSTTALIKAGVYSNGSTGYGHFGIQFSHHFVNTGAITYFSYIEVNFGSKSSAKVYIGDANANIATQIKSNNVPITSAGYYYRIFV